jgi:hypothetical protein
MEMKRYKVTMMVPQEHFIEASDMQAAHNQVSTMIAAYGPDSVASRPSLHSIEPVDEVVVEFDPDFVLE